MNPEEENSNAVPVGEDWFDNWLSTGTVAQRSVDIYGRPDLLGEYDQLQRKLTIAEQVENAKKVELGGGEQRESTQIIERMEELYDLWQASKTTWFIRALSAEETREINAEADGLEEPDEKASAAEKQSHRDKVEEVNERTDLMAIQKALVRVEDAKGNVMMESISMPQLRALKDKVGVVQVSQLVRASLVATSSEPSMPVPLSRSNSRNDRD